MRRTTDHFNGHFPRLRRLAAAVVVLTAFSGVAGGDEAPVYLHADAVIAGEMMYTFKAGGETVNVVRGDFSLTVGRWKMSGRDAVLWVAERRMGGRVFRDIKVYIEGDSARKVTIVQPNGTTTTDRTALVSLPQQGEFRAKVGGHSTDSLESSPLYKRALAERRRQAGAAPDARPAVLLPGTIPATGPATTKPTRPAAPTTAPAPRPYEPVTFRADAVSSEEMPDPRDPARKLRITIAKGNVYLSQGSPESDLFLQMRADAAVIYSLPRAGDETVVREKVIGAYLEGDVIMRRGERTVSGSRLFYDFQAARAIILEMVLRTVQAQRKIPVYVRAPEARQLDALPERAGRAGVKGGKWYFREAIVTTSDFLTPGYHIAAKRVYLEDTTLYDDENKAVSERGWRTKLVNTTFNISSIPVLWLPWIVGDAEEGHTALRKAELGRDGRYGWGLETDWHLFRLLGIPRPEGFKGTLEADLYERGFLIGPKLRYKREHYSGYARGSFMADSEGEDDFGTEREDIDAQSKRGRFLWRHKQFLPRDWQLQLEFSYLSDRNFLEQFYPGEYWTAKPQETLVYAKKQRDNWAFSILGKWRVNDFLTQTEAFPDLAGYLIGRSLWGDRLTFHGEGHVGAVRFRPDNDSGLESSDTTARGDLRAEINAPLAIGPVRLLPSVAGRITGWSDSPRDGGLFRPWGQVGLSALTDIWRIYDNVENRLWDLHRIKHVITPHAGVFFSCTGVQPDRLYPFSPDIEQYLHRLGGGTAGVRQLWQTKRGPPENRHIADWLRLNLSASLFDDDYTHLPSDGRYYFSRPEYSLPRNAINGDAAWYVSDSTVVLGDFNYDIDSGDLGRGNLGVAILRDPRLEYYAGIRYIRDVDSAVGTFGVNYQINRKYRLSAFEQYDFDFDGRQNLSTSLTLTRKFPRLYVAFTFSYDKTYDDVSLMVSIWPEGIPEARLGGASVSLLQRSNEKD